MTSLPTAVAGFQARIKRLEHERDAYRDLAGDTWIMVRDSAPPPPEDVRPRMTAERIALCAGVGISAFVAVGMAVTGDFWNALWPATCAGLGVRLLFANLAAARALDGVRRARAELNREMFQVTVTDGIKRTLEADDVAALARARCHLNDVLTGGGQ
jgi:hypothetical protein